MPWRQTVGPLSLIGFDRTHSGPGVVNFPVGLRVQLVAKAYPLGVPNTGFAYTPGPTVESPFLPLPPPAMRVAFAKEHLPRQVPNTGFANVPGPTVVAPIRVPPIQPIDVHLAPQRPYWNPAHSQIRPRPTAFKVDFQTKPRVGLAPYKWRPPTELRRTPPVVAPAVVQGPQVPFRAWLAKASVSQYKLGFFQVRGPSVVAPPFVPGGLSKPPVYKLAKRNFAVQPARTFRQPVVLTPVTPASLAQMRATVKLTKRAWAVQPTSYKVRPPTVVNPFVPPVITVKPGTDWAAEMSAFF